MSQNDLLTARGHEELEESNLNSYKKQMCIDLVLTAAGNAVLIEEYRNYAARLADKMEEMYGV